MTTVIVKKQKYRVKNKDKIPAFVWSHDEQHADRSDFFDPVMSSPR